jgi:hypothetical protein
MELKTIINRFYSWLLLPILYIIPIIDTSHMRDMPLGLLMMLNLSTINPIAIIYFSGLVCLLLARSLNHKNLYLGIACFGMIITAGYLLSQEFSGLFLTMCSFVVVLLLIEMLFSYRERARKR